MEDEIYNLNDTSFEGLDYGPLHPLLLSTAIPSPLASTASVTTTTVTKDNGMAVWAKAAWTTVFTLMILTAAGGNCIVIWIVTAHRRMRSVTNYFLVNLSTADLLLTLFNCFFNSVYMIERHWPFGKLYCTISNFIANATVSASVFTLTGISCDRYLAIVHPLHPRISKTWSLITITFIWTASIILAMPCLLYSTTVTANYGGRELTGCILIWPDNKLIESKFDVIYQMVFLILTYIVPIILMTVSYSVMGKVLWGSRSIGEMTQRQIDSIRSKRKVVKMFILVVFIFGICWLPYHGYFIYIFFDPYIIYKSYTQHLYLGFYWFAMSNAMVNPLIYYWMNARFRQYFNKVICGWKRCLRTSRSQSGDSPPMIDRHSHSYTRSAMGGGGGTMKVLVNNPEGKDNAAVQNGSAKHTLVNSNKDMNRRRSRSVRGSSCKRNNTLKTTVNL